MLAIISYMHGLLMMEIDIQRYYKVCVNEVTIAMSMFLSNYLLHKNNKTHQTNSICKEYT